MYSNQDSVVLLKEQRDQWNRSESPEISLHKYGKLNFEKGAKAIQWGKVLQRMMLKKLDIHMKKK